MAKNDARKNGFEKTNPEDLAAKEEKFRTFFSTSVAQVPDEMKHRDDEKQEPAKQKTQSSILGRILGRAKEEAEPASEKPAMPQELPPTGMNLVLTRCIVRVPGFIVCKVLFMRGKL